MPVNQNLLRLSLSTKHAKINDNNPASFTIPNKSFRSHNELYKYNNDFLNINDNLSSTSAESFEIKRCYKNLIQISGGRYLRDQKIQKRVIKIVKGYDRKKSKLEYVTKRLNSNFDIQKLKSHREEDNQLKKIENNIRAVTTKMSDILLKKMKKKKGKNTNKDIHTIKSYVSVSPKSKKRVKKQLSLNPNIDNNNSSLRLNSLYVNQDESLGKLNSSKNELIKLNIPQEKMIFQLNNIDFNIDKKK